jgi:hypothetical protein
MKASFCAVSSFMLDSDWLVNVAMPSRNSSATPAITWMFFFKYEHHHDEKIQYALR